MEEKSDFKDLGKLITQRVERRNTVNGVASVRNEGLIQGAGYRVIRNYHFLSKDVRVECSYDNEPDNEISLRDCLDSLSQVIKPYDLESKSNPSSGFATVTIKPKELSKGEKYLAQKDSVIKIR